MTTDSAVTARAGAVSLGVLEVVLRVAAVGFAVLGLAWAWYGLTGRPVWWGGQPVAASGSIGTVVLHGPESEAFSTEVYERAWAAYRESQQASADGVGQLIEPFTLPVMQAQIFADGWLGFAWMLTVYLPLLAVGVGLWLLGGLIRSVRRGEAFRAGAAARLWWLAGLTFLAGAVGEVGQQLLWRHLVGLRPVTDFIAPPNFVVSWWWPVAAVFFAVVAVAWGQAVRMQRELVGPV